MIVARTIRGRGWRTHYVEAPAERASLSLCGVGGAWLPTRGEEPTCPVCRARRAKAVREMVKEANAARVGARVCRGCGGQFPITCTTGTLDGYWHLSCLLRARGRMVEQ